MYKTILYGEKIYGETLREIKQKANKIANSKYQPVDKMEVSAGSYSFVLSRDNDTSSAIIKHGRWQ